MKTCTCCLNRALVGERIFLKLFRMSSPVSTLLGPFKRGFLEKGEQVCLQIEFDFGLRAAKVAILLAILG